MYAHGPLLTVLEGHGGTFASWLKEIGLEDFLKQHPIEKLVEWKWLRPLRRIVFPRDFFANWQDFPYTAAGMPPELRDHSLLWGQSWFIDDESEPYWFLNPFFRPGASTDRMLRIHDADSSLPEIPAKFQHSNGTDVAPYVDYFYHWQAFALIDVIQASDCFEPLFNTPDVEAHAQGVVRIAKLVKEINPADVLDAPTRWSGLAKLMTWISHYRALRDAIWILEERSETNPESRRRGARLLAEHLGITTDTLAEEIKGKLLVLAQSWCWTIQRKNHFAETAWPFLQQDIQMAMEWLCFLSGQPMEHFLNLWTYPHRGQEFWAELRAVLPYGYISDRAKFLSVVPFYLKHFKTAPDRLKLRADEDLRNAVDVIRQTNVSFSSLIGAFKQLHDELSHSSRQKGQIDFRERRPLDSYAVVAFRAETCLREALDHKGLLNSVPRNDQALHGYILRLCALIGLSLPAQEWFRLNHRPLTQLRDGRAGAIDRVLQIETGLSDLEHELVQAFLATCLARNYFAHHRDLDNELLRSEKSGFLLGGIILTVLCLTT